MVGMEELSVTKYTLVSIFGISDISLPVQLLMYNPLDALDGAMVTIAMNVAHPGILLALSPNKQVDKTLSA